MFRKLALSVAALLGLMALAVSAQTPAPFKEQPQAPPGYYQPSESLPAGTVGMLPFNYGYARGGASAEELELTRQGETLVKQLAKADGENKDKIKAKLTQTLEKQFDVRQKRHETELTALEAQVKKLKEMVQKRQENRKDIIGKRLEQLVRDTEGLGW